MQISTLLIVFFILAIVSVLVIRISDGRMVRKRVITSRAKEILKKVEELKDTTVAVGPLLSRNDIPLILLDEQIDLLQDVAQISKSPFIEEAINVVSSQRRDLEEKNFTQNRALKSDAAIARHGVFLNDASAVLLKRKKTNKISEDQFKEYIAELSWAKLMINIVPQIIQSEQLKGRGEEMKAYAFLKNALRNAQSSKLSDKRKKELITEIKDYLSGQRQSLSTHLIPEISRYSN